MAQVNWIQDKKTFLERCIASCYQEELLLNGIEEACEYCAVRHACEEMASAMDEIT